RKQSSRSKLLPDVMPCHVSFGCHVGGCRVTSARSKELDNAACSLQLPSHPLCEFPLAAAGGGEEWHATPRHARMPRRRERQRAPAREPSWCGAFAPAMHPQPQGRGRLAEKDTAQRLCALPGEA